MDGNPLWHITIRAGYPDFDDLPWGYSLAKWAGRCSNLVEVPSGTSRHPVVFVNEQGKIYAFKELPAGVAEREYRILIKAEELRLPAVMPVGYASISSGRSSRSVLITRFLDYSIPYRSLFMSDRLFRYREHLLDALAGLLVQLHLADIFWGDSSLSNTLFRRDAGALRAYLVDAETSEYFPNDIPAYMRHQDLDIMESNINGELADLRAEGAARDDPDYLNAGASVRVRYQRLWEEISQEVRITQEETFRIQERIRALNSLGFSVGDVELFETPDGSQLRLRIAVTDRSFHHDQLFNLTGILAEEKQAQKMMNEIQELRATLAQQNSDSTPLSVAAYHWLKNIYQPTIEKLQDSIGADLDEVEMYCQVLEHKWYLSEKAQRDVGHEAAALDYLHKIINKQTE